MRAVDIGPLLSGPLMMVILGTGVTPAKTCAPSSTAAAVAGAKGVAVAALWGGWMTGFSGVVYGSPMLLVEADK